MLTMPPGALQGQRSVGPPKVVGEILKGAVLTVAGEGAATPRMRRSASEYPSSGAPVAAAMVLAKDMVTGRKSSGVVATANPQSPRAARSSGIPIRPKPVPPSVSARKTVPVAAIGYGDGRKQQPKFRRPTSTERVKVLIYYCRRGCVYACMCDIANTGNILLCTSILGVRLIFTSSRMLKDIFL